MYIKIAPGFIREPQWGVIVNESIFVTILEDTFVPETEEEEAKAMLVVQISPASNRSTKGRTPDIPNGIEVEVESENYHLPYLYNKLKEKLVELIPNIVEANIVIEAEEIWQDTFGTNLEVPRPIRITIPKDLLLTVYEPLMSRVKQGWRDDGVAEIDFPFKVDTDNATVYLNNLANATVDELNYIQNDFNVLIENNAV
jgi:hypothetical protein